MQPLHKLFNAIKNEPRTTVKIKLLRDYDNQPLLQMVLNYAYSNVEIFGITASSIKLPYCGVSTDFPVELFGLIKSCSGRNDKIKLIQNELMKCNREISGYVLGVIDKDLNIGINRKLINKAMGFELVPDFPVMLAWKQDERRWLNTFSLLKWCYLNVKVDGIRCVIYVKSPTDITFFSRDGKQLQPFLTERIHSEIVKNYKLFDGRVVDGEISSNFFQKLMRVVGRKNITFDSIYIRNSVKLSIFDLIDIGHLPLTERVAAMNVLKTQVDSHVIKFLKYHRVIIDYKLISTIARKYIDSGAEGIIIKNPNALYQPKRSNDWLKFKDKNTIDLKIVGYYQGEKNTEFEHCLGGITVKYKNTTINVGSGFTPDERREFWIIREQLIDIIAELSYMEETKTGSLRHLVFERFRHDKETTDE